MVVFYIRASFWLPSFSFHDNRASLSRDTIWPWKFKINGKGQSTPVSTASCWLISLAFHIRASYRLQSPSFHDIWVSHSRDTIWPWQFKVKGQGQSQRKIFSHTHRSTMCGLKKLASGVIPESWKVLAERRRRRRRRRKRTKNNKSPGYPGWLNYNLILLHILLSNSKLCSMFTGHVVSSVISNTFTENETHIFQSWKSGLDLLWYLLGNYDSNSSQE